MKILKIFLILSSLFLFVHADDDHHKEHKYKNLEYLNLNKSQVKELKKVLIEFKHNYNEFYEEKEKNEKELKDIMESENFDKERYIETYRRINHDLAVLEANKMEKIHKILTPKQREKFAKYLEEWEID